MANKGIATGIDFNLLVVAALVQKLGGTVTVTQADLDAVAFMTLLDKGERSADGNWNIELSLKTPRASG